MSGARVVVFVRDRAGVGDVLTSITPVTMSPGTAIYRMLRTDPPHGRVSYEVRFQIDGDGVWRLSSL